MTTDANPNQALAAWNKQLSTALRVPPADIDTILSLAGDIAHGVVRPAAPLSTYLVGYASAVLAAGGMTPEDAVAHAVAVARELAQKQPEA